MVTNLLFVLFFSETNLVLGNEKNIIFPRKMLFIFYTDNPEKKMSNDLKKTIKGVMIVPKTF